MSSMIQTELSGCKKNNLLKETKKSDSTKKQFLFCFQRKAPT